jgi:hypothetical protein
MPTEVLARFLCGTLSHGYTFGVQQGLSLRGTGAFNVYSMRNPHTSFAAASAVGREVV